MGTKSGFFRSRQGGRFKQRQASDLGLQAFKDREAAAIKAEEENLRTLLSYRDEAQRSLERKGANEIWNLEQFDILENKAHANTIRATKVRNETDLDRIKESANIAANKSKWLNDWAPNFYRNIYTAGTNVTELYQRYDADKKFNELISSGKFDQYVDIWGNLDAKARADVIAGRNKAFADDDIEAVDYLRDVLNTSNTYLSEKIANQLIERTEDLEQSLKSYVLSPDGSGAGEWKAENVHEFYLMRARELVRQFGLQGKGAQKLIAHFDKRGALESASLADNERLVSDKKQRNIAKDNVLSFRNDSSRIKDDIQNAVITYRTNSYREGDYGKIEKGFKPNTADAFVELFKDVISTGKVENLEKLKDDFLDSCTPGTSGNKCVTWRTRYEKSGDSDTPSLVDRLDEQIKLVGKALLKKSQDQLESNDGFALTDWNHQRAGTGPYAPGGEKEGEALTSITTESHVKLAFEAYRRAKANNNPNTMKAIGNILYINPDTQTKSAIIEGLWRESIQGDTEGAAWYWLQLSDADRNDPRLQKLYKPIEVIDAAGHNKTSISKRLKVQIETFVGEKNLLGGKTLNQSAKQLIDYHEERFYVHLNDLYSTGKYEPSRYTQLIEDAFNQAEEDLQSGEGIYKTESDQSGTSKVFTMFKRQQGGVEPGTEDLKAAVEKADGNLNDEDVLNIFGARTFKETALDIQQGKPIDLPDSVHIAYELSDKTLTKTEFVNNLLKHYKFDERIRLKPNKHDIVQTKVNKLWGDEEQGYKISIRGKDVGVMDAYTNIVNQSLQYKKGDVIRYPDDGAILLDEEYDYPIPMPNYYRFKELKAALQAEHPGVNFDTLTVSEEGVVSTGDQQTYNILLKDKAKLGLKFKANDAGGFDLVSESPLMWQSRLRKQQYQKEMKEVDEAVNKATLQINKNEELLKLFRGNN